MRPSPIRNPPNPWHTTEVRYLGEPPPCHLTVYRDGSRSILSKNDSPDLGFHVSVNPYRGCMHACAYCYARPSHEVLDFGAGTDFERKIVVKPDAPELLRRAFDRKSWRGETIVFSGVTDCYQPLEASYRLTRRCLEVCREYRNPVCIVTKSPLIERDLDVLVDLHEHARLHVAISIPLWDRDVARAIEPGVATPQRRVETIRRLAEAGLSVAVMVAPLIPGLGDADMPRILQAAAQAGATSAAMVMLRLPGSVAAVFEARVREAMPLRAEKILSRIRDVRGGQLNDPRFGSRMRGEGPYAQAMAALFARAAERLGLRERCGEPRDAAQQTPDDPPPEAPIQPRQTSEPSPFRRPTSTSAQLSLYPDPLDPEAGPGGD